MFRNMKAVRVVIYLIGVAAQVASFFVTIYSPELAQAFSQTSDVLGTLALGTALTNMTDFGTAEGDHRAV